MLILQTVLRKLTKYAKIYLLYRCLCIAYSSKVIYISGSSNGRTPGFGPGNLGSNPSPEAMVRQAHHSWWDCRNIVPVLGDEPIRRSRGSIIKTARRSILRALSQNICAM